MFFPKGKNAFNLSVRPNTEYSRDKSYRNFSVYNTQNPANLFKLLGKKIKVAAENQGNTHPGIAESRKSTKTREKINEVIEMKGRMDYLSCKYLYSLR